MKSRKYIFLVLLQAPVWQFVFAQVEDNWYYKHLEGTMGEAMKIKMELMRFGNVLTGSYYYFQEENGYYGSTIPLKGEVDDKQNYKLYGFSDRQSYFSGSFSNSKTLAGFWLDKNNDKRLNFELRESYDDGGYPLDVYHLRSSYYMNRGEQSNNADPQAPKAQIEIVFLFADYFRDSPRTQRISKVLTTNFFAEKGVLDNDPDALMSRMKEKFFNTYKSATEGIVELENPASFNWEKKRIMTVRFNEQNILCLEIQDYVFTGGAHGLTNSKFVVLNLATGEKLELNHLFDEMGLVSLNQMLDNKLRKKYSIPSDEGLKGNGFFIDEVEYSENFYLIKDGIGFFYNPYEIATYVTGAVDLFLGFREIKYLLRDDHPLGWIDP